MPQYKKVSPTDLRFPTLAVENTAKMGHGEICGLELLTKAKAPDRMGQGLL
jgi:hypothetical protein